MGEDAAAQRGAPRRGSAHAVEALGAERGASQAAVRRRRRPGAAWRLPRARRSSGRRRRSPFADAVGRLAAESLAAYPPGIPNVLPGERLTQETVDYISAVVEHGGWVRGAVDRSLRTDAGGGRVSATRPGASTPSTAAARRPRLPAGQLPLAPTSAISRATLEAGHRFDGELARRQHAAMVAAYEEAGVRVHLLEPDPALPYQVFARDSSVMTRVER